MHKARTNSIGRDASAVQDGCDDLECLEDQEDSFCDVESWRYSARSDAAP